MSLTSRSTIMAVAAASAGLLGLIWAVDSTVSLAQGTDAGEATAPGKPAARPAQKPAPKAATKPGEKAAAAAPAQAAAPPPDFAGRLKEAGAGTCAAQINALAAGTMSAVGQFNTASNWPTGTPDKRLVSVSLGQKYPDGNAVPFAATNIVAAPNPQGTCDAFAFQVIPSPFSCGKLRETLVTANGRQIGDLAGVPLIQDAGGQTLLIPTAAETCVLIGMRTAYAK